MGDSRLVDPTDLLYLLEIARKRTHVAAAAALGVNHTTVARRIRALEREVGDRLFVASIAGWELTPAGRKLVTAAERVEAAMKLVPDVGGLSADHGIQGRVRINATEVFGLLVVVPALSQVSRSHPRITFELVSVTRPMHTYGPNSDLDIGVTRPKSARVVTRRLADYELGLFASRSYLAEHELPSSLADLALHKPIYYVESMLQIADLDLVERLFAKDATVNGATSVLAQLDMTRRGLGIGILPKYLARQEQELVSVLPTLARAVLTYWMTARSENLRRPEVRAVADAIEAQTKMVFEREVAE
jgi:DNA-binding transcriptional LysR family regulator